MSLISYTLGQGSIVLRIKILNSSVLTGAGLTALTSASSGLIISTIADNEATPTTYTVAGSTIETIATLGTYAAPTATKCRFKEVDATNHKGVYEVQIADARYNVSSCKSVLISISGATNAAETDAVIPLTTGDPYAADGNLLLTNANLAHVDSNERTNVGQWLSQAVTKSATTNLPEVDAKSISDDATAANNLEAAHDGTGYIGGTIKQQTDMVAISGDTVAADNLESQYDTTGLAGDTFPSTQSQLSKITNVGSAVHRPAASYVLTTGTQSANTVTATEALDGTNHEHTDAAGAMDLYYEFDIGSGVPSSVTVTGYLNSANDDLEVYGWDWVASAWVQIGQLSGKGASTNDVNSYDLFVDMVGSGANFGKVRVRFTDGAFTLTSATLAVDQVFVSFSLSTEGYENGAIWIDTNVSNTNTVPGVDGVASNPVSTMAAANTLAAALNINRFEIASGSAITLAATQNDQVFNGINWTLALGGQDIAGSMFHGAKSVTGIASGTGTGQMFRSCTIGTSSHIKGTRFVECGIADTTTIVEAGDYFWDRCYSAIAGTGTPVLDFGALIGNTNANWRNYSGGIQVENMGDTGTDTMSLEGRGQFVEGTCTGGTVAIRGLFTTSGIANLTLSDDARFDSVQLVDDFYDEVNTGATHNVTNSGGPQLRQASTTGLYEGGQVWIDTINGAAGTDVDENGTVISPSDNIADATTLATAKNISRFRIAPGSTFTLAQTYSNWVFESKGHWTLALGGQSINDISIINAVVTGTCTSTDTPHFFECEIGIATLPPCDLHVCELSGTITLSGAGDYLFETCVSAIAGTGTPVIDFGAAVGSTNLNMRRYSGGIEVQNMGQTGTDNMSLEGDGQLIINVNCTGGTIVIRGNFAVTDNSSGAVTIVYDDNTSGIAAILADHPQRITKNVALANFPFLMVDSTDNVTGKTGLTFGAGDAQVSIDGAAFTNLTNLPTELSNGAYVVDLAAADNNGDTLLFRFSGTGADDRFIAVVTQPT